MTYRHALEQHRHDLEEIRSIMSSMKNLAMMEARRVSRFIEYQQRVVDSLEAAAADLLASFPDLLPQASATTDLVLVIGSERGFCGDFNERLLQSLAHEVPGGPPGIIAVGRKLGLRLGDDPRIVAAVPGAHVAEEIPRTLQALVAAMGSLKTLRTTRGLQVLYHAGDENVIAARSLIPPFQNLPAPARRFAYPPQLNLAPDVVLGMLIDHYLFAALHQVFYLSLLAENRRRVEHLESAIQRLAEKADELAMKCRNLRQEEITEEIEVILLSADNPIRPGQEKGGKRG